MDSDRQAPKAAHARMNVQARLEQLPPRQPALIHGFQTLQCSTQNTNSYE